MRQLVSQKPVTGLVAEFENLEMICSVRIDTVLYDLPGAPTGKRGRPRIHGERIDPGSIPLEKPEELDYYTGCREVMTNLWKGKHVHAYVTASDPDDRNSYRLFLSTVPADGIHINAREHADRKIRQYNECGMLPMGVFRSAGISKRDIMKPKLSGRSTTTWYVRQRGLNASQI